MAEKQTGEEKETTGGTQTTNDTSRTAVFTVVVDLDTGKLQKISVCGDGTQRNISAERLADIFNGERQFRYVGTILHSHSSPGCVYWIGDMAVELC